MRPNLKLSLSLLAREWRLPTSEVRLLTLRSRNGLLELAIGMTLHSWGAIAPSVGDVDKLISYIKTARPALLRWRRTEVLIIDEGPSFYPARRTALSQICWSQCRW